MAKRILVLGALLFGLSTLSAFAEESITITTYYPSPYGSYNQLEVYRSVRYRPTSAADRVAFTNKQPGELVYGDDDKFYHWNGSDWVAQGGGGGPGGWDCINASGVPQAICPAGYKVITGGCDTINLGIGLGSLTLSAAFTGVTNGWTCLYGPTGSSPANAHAVCCQ